MSNENELMEVEVVNQQGGNAGALQVADMDYIVKQAEMADKYIVAVNKIIEASLKITKDSDWVLIGGKPYLQQFGAAKVAKLFGISWKILKIDIETDNDGYKTFLYTIEMWDKNQTIEAQGSRSMRDDFFAGKNCSKKPEQINEKDVRASAYTSAINSGIKNIVPGLRSVTVQDLANAGIDTSKLQGYTFKTGSQGGTDQRKAETSGLKCEVCGKAITQQAASFSESKFKQKLCFDCQNKLKQNAAVKEVSKTISSSDDLPY